MRYGVLLLGVTCLALGGCGGKPAVANHASQHEDKVADPQKEMESRWAKLFADPAAVIAAANEFGYKVGPLKAPESGAAGASTDGVEQILPNPTAPVTVTTNVRIQSAAANRVESVAFSFDISDATRDDSPALSKTQRYPARIVDGFLGRFQVGSGDDIKRAIKARTSAETTRYGAKITVDAVPLPRAPKGRRLIVTFSKSPESAARK
jgi:hypothetical protein